jgi:hypothetical protein
MVCAPPSRQDGIYAAANFKETQLTHMQSVSYVQSMSMLSRTTRCMGRSLAQPDVALPLSLRGYASVCNRERQVINHSLRILLN